MRHLPALALVMGVLSGCAGSNLHLGRLAPYAPLATGDLSGEHGPVRDEARQFIEFAVELDSQDERWNAAHGGCVAPERISDPTSPRPPTRNDGSALCVLLTPEQRRSIPFEFDVRQDIVKDWGAPLYDSRRRVAEDVMSYLQTGKPPHNLPEVLYEKIRKRGEARRKGTKAAPYGWEWSVDNVAAQADINGFGPYDGAWVLHRRVNPQGPPDYLIALRGTVMGSLASMYQDVILHPVAAKTFLSPDIRFARSDQAEVHSGFAHGAFHILFDERYGVLAELARQKVEDGARLFIVGHSQGAAMATLVHAFLEHAMRTPSSDPFLIKGRDWRLKSYAYAQPKPGNAAFAADFAGYTQPPRGTAVVINNDLDPVTQVPLTVQSPNEALQGIPLTNVRYTLMKGVLGVASLLREAHAGINEPLTDSYSYGPLYREDHWTRLEQQPVGSSWNFTPAGQMTYVYGDQTTVEGARPTDDLFLQHHAWYYRKLICAQLQPKTGCSKAH